MATAKKIIKNTSYLSGAYIAQKILSFVYFTLIANLAGVSDTGAYVFALSYTTIFSVFADFGLANLMQRTIANDATKTEQTVKRMLGVKLIYGVITILVSLFFIHFLTDDTLTIQMVYVALGIMIVDSFNLTVWSAFRGQHKLGYEALSVIMGQTIILIVGISGLLLSDNLLILVFALLAGSSFSALFATIICKKKLGFWPIPENPRKLDKRVVREAIPFGLANTFTRIFSSADSVMLRVLVNEAAVGFYSVPNKIVFALQFIPSAFAATIYPAMSHYYQKDNDKIVEIFKQALIFLMLLSVPTAIGIFFLTPVIIGQIFDSSYAPSIPAMYILVWGLIFGFCEFPIGALLNATHNQKKNMITRGVVMGVNIVMNFFLIPLYSFTGAAISALVSYFLLTAMGLYWAKDIISIPWGELTKALAKIMISAIIMAIVLTISLNRVHYALIVVIGAVVYGGMVLFLRVIDPKQLKQTYKTMRSK